MTLLVAFSANTVLRKYGFSDFSKSMEMAASWDVALCGVVDVE
jgi:hypothetical protein